MRHQTGEVIHRAGVNAIRPSRLCVKLQGFTGDDPDDFLGTVNPLPENMLSMSDFRNRQAIVLSVATLGGANVPIASSWIPTLHVATKTLHADTLWNQHLAKWANGHPNG